MTSIVVNVPGDLHIHVHEEGLAAEQYQALVTLLEDIKTLSVKINVQGDTIMALIDDLNAALAEANVATNEIAADITEILDKLSGGVSAAEGAALAAQLGAHVTSLKAVAAAYTADTVPPVEPPPVEPPPVEPPTA